MTHEELVTKAERWLRNQGCSAVVAELKAVTNTGEIPDALGFRQGVSILIECKTSRADFLKDKKKPFRKKPQNGVGDWRFFLCPENIIYPKDLPDGWGLLHSKGQVIKKIHGVPSNCSWATERPFISNKDNEAIILASKVRRLEEEIQTMRKESK